MLEHNILIFQYEKDDFEGKYCDFGTVTNKVMEWGKDDSRDINFLENVLDQIKKNCKFSGAESIENCENVKM